MNAIEEIQAAIEKLTRQRDAATAGVWVDYGGFISGRAGQWVSGDSRSVDSALIVTLHRTIDAQLAILQLAITFAEITHNVYTDTCVDLARAINGDTP